MFDIDTELILDVASKVTRLKMFPYFDAAHYVMMVLAVREDLATGMPSFLFDCIACFMKLFLGRKIG